MQFYVGIHQPSDAKHLGAVFVSVNRLSGPKGRKRPFTSAPWILDSGAFTTIAKHGGYPESVSVYAAHIRRWAAPNLRAAVAQDYMCEATMLAKTGLTIADHQRLTIERYDALLAEDLAGVTLMPVLQGYAPSDYARHVRAYGSRLAPGAYVGVGSVCKRNVDPGAIVAILDAIHAVRPDLRLHGFGLKSTALAIDRIRNALESADSMAWSFAARYEGRGGNDWREAARLVAEIDDLDLTVSQSYIQANSSTESKMNVQLDETLIAEAKRAPRHDGLSKGERIALNLLWRKKVRVPVLAKVFRCSKNTIYYNCLTGDAASYPGAHKAREINETIDRMGEDAAWEQYVTPTMIRAVNAANKELIERRRAA